MTTEKEVWDQLDAITRDDATRSSGLGHSNPTSLSHIQLEESSHTPLLCGHCGSDGIDVLDDFKIICFSCGVTSTFATDVVTNEFTPNEIPQRYCKKSSKELCKLQKRLGWCQYTNEEKNEYKLKSYIEELCGRLGISEGLVSQIKSTVVDVMNIIKSTEGTKRARVKDGIILACIEYVGKRNGVSLSATKLGKSIDIDIKYVTKAEGILLELLHTKKLALDKHTLLSTRTPFGYVEDMFRKRRLNVSSDVLDTVKRVIQICETNEFLLDHTPLSIGVSCFYYVISDVFDSDDGLDIREFAQMYNLSVVTVAKTTAKLKEHDGLIQQSLRESLS
jgi:transcription initiation factor TFIIIB Brf1 subunit/transcription initiation factor TFIIB